MAELGPEEGRALCEALEGPAPTSVRLHPQRPCRWSGAEAIPWSPAGRYLTERPSFTLDPAFHAGAYYVQEASSQFLAHVLAGEEVAGKRILDLCAAPGGKTTLYASLAGSDGLVVANEVNRQRAAVLADNVRKWGLGNVAVTVNEPAQIAVLEGWFDIVAVDAPCSGEGMFRKDKKMVKAWEEHGPEFFSKIQRSIVTQAAQMLRPGGMLLYSTCTFSPEENEQTIEYLLQEYTEFKICEMEGYEGFADGMPQVTESKNPEFEKTVRIFPHRMKGEGHFLALLQKGEKQEEGKRLPESGKNKKLPEELEEFLGHIDRKFDSSRMDLRGEKVYYMPEGLPTLRGIRFLRTGLLMGELKKNRFEPSQALAMNLKKEEYDQVIDLPLEDERVMKYLKGETLDVEDLVKPKDKGWYLICVDGYPLGFGKLVNQMLKNKYLPGWRWNS